MCKLFLLLNSLAVLTTWNLRMWSRSVCCHVTQRFITVIIKACHWSVSWISSHFSIHVVEMRESDWIQKCEVFTAVRMWTVALSWLWCDACTVVSSYRRLGGTYGPQSTNSSCVLPRTLTSPKSLFLQGFPTNIVFISCVLHSLPILLL
jgi:hypothetical protein